MEEEVFPPPSLIWSDTVRLEEAMTKPEKAVLKKKGQGTKKTKLQNQSQPSNTAPILAENALSSDSEEDSSLLPSTELEGSSEVPSVETQSLQAASSLTLPIEEDSVSGSLYWT